MFSCEEYQPSVGLAGFGMRKIDYEVYNFKNVFLLAQDL